MGIHERPRDDDRRERALDAAFASSPREADPVAPRGPLVEILLTVLPILPAWIWAGFAVALHKGPWLAKATRSGTTLPGWSDGVLILVIGAAMFFFASAFASLGTWNRSRAAPVSDAERGCVAVLVRTGGIGFSYWAAYLLAHAA